MRGGAVSTVDAKRRFVFAINDEELLESVRPVIFAEEEEERQQRV